MLNQIIIFPTSNRLRSQVCSFIKKDTLTQVFFCEFCEIFKDIFFIKQLEWLLFNITFKKQSPRGVLRKMCS